MSCLRRSATFAVSIFSAAILLAFLGPISTSPAADFSFRGAFATDDQVQLFEFNLATASTVELRTFSYGGGTQADGTVVLAGGFDPVVSIFDGSGLLLDLVDDDETFSVPADPNTGLARDSLLSDIFDAGDYTVALTQYDNLPLGPGLADGFLRTGDPDFTGDLFGPPGGGMFYESIPPTISQRTNVWALDISNVTAAAAQVPEPAGWAAVASLLLAGLLVVATQHRRRWQTAVARISSWPA
jgi:hypothetical protein